MTPALSRFLAALFSQCFLGQCS